MEVIKSITLNLLQPTKIKREALNGLRRTYKKALSFVVAQNIKVNRFRLQSMFYNYVREFGLHSQIANDLFKDAVTILSNSGTVKHVTIPYNIPRGGKFASTENGNPVISIATLNGGKIAIPIAMDGIYQRYKRLLKEGYKTTFFRLNHFQIHITLKKKFPIREDYDAILGVDVGVKRLVAISVISQKGKILKQLYFGKDVGNKQRDIDLRRSKLRSYADKGSRYAKQALRRLRKCENNHTITRCWQVAHEVVRLAEKYNAFIAIEDLKHLRDAKGSRKGNRKAKKMPYHKFRVALESVAGQNNRLVVAVSPRNTSHICSRCGAKGTRNNIFNCSNCGNKVNADRNASVNVAIRAGIIHPNINGFFSQLSGGNLAVNQGDFVHDGIGIRCLQHHISSPRQARLLS